ncbi:Uncharacterized protein PECH_000533 [Penicillium ucsense]|uniref:LipA and NB-ARC domain protein n=1 Tax=Penicillium ucsense TaxID=2839758 RepID=A0A8J8WH34_9EURO|nr:Uncharacterized protein PECM_008906 [Penicillium ucsense]KAF7733493.1 Uncharacterized protein PECH_000533 [Penicillium ucsense]
MGSIYLHPENGPDDFKIRRKPVSNPNLRGTAMAQAPGPGGLLHAATSSYLAPSLSSQPPSYEELYGPNLSLPEQETLTRPRTAVASNNPASFSQSPSPSPSTATAPSSSRLQKAYGEACHFLGGLINHPTESNKHVTVLRHSHGLVFYRGLSTSVAVSIFSDAPLPQDRTVWLQDKGWSGKAGMRAKALFRLNNNWIDVTPGIPLHADQVAADDERAWQRDIKKFLRKPPSGAKNQHLLRETVVIRIPAEAGDGYFQLVICQGAKKKVLGYSPVFRVISTSANPHSMRGASLSTMPLEVGAMVVSLYARSAAKTVMTPATTVVQSKVTQYRPAWVKETAVRKAYQVSGLQNRVTGVHHGFSSSPAKRPVCVAAPCLIERETEHGVEVGPQPPFPTAFEARVQLKSSSIESSVPESSSQERLTLLKVPDWVLEQMCGYYFGWARFKPGFFDTPAGQISSAAASWSPAVLSVSTLDPLQAAGVNMSQATKRVVRIRLLEHAALQTNKLEIRVMGFLRAEIPPPTGHDRQALMEAQAAAAEAAVLADAYDVSVVQGTLLHPAWAPDTRTREEMNRENAGWVDKTLQGYEQIVAKGQRWVEQVPLHRLGVRSTADEWRERQVAANGFYIVR